MTRQLLSRAWLRKERCSLLGRETHASLFPSRMFFCDTSFSVFLSFFLPPSFPTEARSRTLCWLLHRLLSVCLFDWWTDKHPTKEVRKRKKRKITLHTKQIVVYYFYLPVKKKKNMRRNKCGSFMASRHVSFSRVPQKVMLSVQVTKTVTRNIS